MQVFPYILSVLARRWRDSELRQACGSVGVMELSSDTDRVLAAGIISKTGITYVISNTSSAVVNEAGLVKIA